MIRPAIETVLSAILLAAAPFILLFGIDGIVILVYGFFPIETRRWLWEVFPPQSARVGLGALTAVATLTLIAGLFVSAGLWGAYPTWRKAFVLLTIVMLMSVGITVELVYSGPMIRF